MKTITGRNVNETYRESISTILLIGERQDSRNGPVLVAPYPVVTVTENPTERVLFCPNRDANPFFHFFECLWMMSGSRDGTWLDQFVRDFSSRYAEPDGNIHGAYGARWRDWWSMDQLRVAVDLLRTNRNDRRVVIQMWDPASDLDAQVRDVPCNTQIFPRIREEESGYVLDLSVMCRSNDIIWGATGANAVHFSFLQEWMAAQIGVGVGKMYQFSNNWHAYDQTLEKIASTSLEDPYVDGVVKPYPICDRPEKWDEDLRLFMDWPSGRRFGYQNAFFSRVAVPMLEVHRAWRRGDRALAFELVNDIEASDWRLACMGWMGRRAK